MVSISNVLRKLALSAGILSLIAFIIYLAKVLFESYEELAFPPAVTDFLSWSVTGLVAAVCIYMLSVGASLWND